MSQNPNRLLDKTHLSIDTAEERGFIHRDYIAHCFRWSYVVKFLMQRHRYKDAHILDIGCGKDQPLPRLLYANKMTGFDWTGVDMNAMDFHETLVTAHQNGKIRVALHEQTDASLLDPAELSYGLADYIVCFEVLEHMQPHIANRMLKNWKNLLKPDGYLFVSTPVYNGSAAANHINEMGRETLGAAFEHRGFTILGNWGTFASQSDLVPRLSDAERIVYDKLSEYYDSNVLSTTLAPLHPEGSRNNLWLLSNNPPRIEDHKFYDPGMPMPPDDNQNNRILDLYWGEDWETHVAGAG